jgi:ferrochelatase
MSTPTYDAILVLSFGGPEKPEDVMPFLETVVRGRGVPRERLLEVAEHYEHFGGRSPINDQNRALIAALEAELAEHGPQLPIYWGNRNWDPFLKDTLREMADRGVGRTLAFVTSAYSSYSSCRQYLQDIEAAREAVGPRAPRIDKLRAFFNHPGFLEPFIDGLCDALASFGPERASRAQTLFTAHSVPMVMASGSRYVEQLEEAVRIVSEAAGAARSRLVFQSRSGPPSVPWLEPDVLDALREIRDASNTTDVAIVPIGFVSDHLEVLYDLDVEAAALCRDGGLNLRRVATPGVHPKFVSMVRELIAERLDQAAPRRALGSLGVPPDICEPDCCPAPRRPSR